MPFARLDDVELLGALYEGGLQEQRWGAFLTGLQRRLSVDEVSLVFETIHSAKPKVWSSGSTPQTLPFGLATMRPERVYALEELAPPTGAATAEFGRALRVNEAGTWSAWLIARRAFNDLSSADSARLSAFAPHLAIAMRNFAVLERTRLQAAIAEAALARAGVAVMALDYSGRVAHRTPGAATTPDLERTLRDFAEKPRTSEPALLRLGPERVALMVSIDETPVQAQSDAALLVLERAASPPAQSQATCIQEMWALSPNEARLALAISNGQSLAEAAVTLGITEETARNYSKKIYAKTGARGMPDLVRLVLTSMCALA